MPLKQIKTRIRVPLLLSLTVTLLFTYLLWSRMDVYGFSSSRRGPSLRPTPGRPGPRVGELVDLVNVFVGTTNGGHVFPGATIPHGMVKAGMDTNSPGNHAGYDALPQYNVTGFSQLHDDGTGGATPLSNFKLFPIRSCPDLTHCKTTIYERSVKRAMKPLPDGTKSSTAPDDYGTPGYFATNLSNGIRVELTATRRVALHRYTFPPPPTGVDLKHPTPQDYAPRLLLDMVNDGQFSGTSVNLTIEPFTPASSLPENQRFNPNPAAIAGGGGGEVGKNLRMRGGAKFISSFGRDQYPAYVCVDVQAFVQAGPPTPGHGGHGRLDRRAPTGNRFDGWVEIGGPISHGVYVRQDTRENITTLGHGEGGPEWGEKGGILTFPSSPTSETVLVARVGISLMSESQACSNAESEVPADGKDGHGRNFLEEFERVRKDARDQWETVLSRIQVGLEGEVEYKDQNGDKARRKVRVEKEDAVLFYSSVYRSHVVPADYSGENPLWKSEPDMPYYDSLYCNWDTYRTLFPLLSLTDPSNYARVVRSFIDIQKHEGWLPECRGSTTQQFIQGGSHGDPILAEFYVKYAHLMEKFKINPDELWNALVKDAEEESPDWEYKGRQAGVYKELGYLPTGEWMLPGGMNTRQVSRTLEYAFDDFTISQVARYFSPPKLDEMKKYLNRSGWYENVWNPETPILDVEEKEVAGIKGFMQPRYRNGTFKHTDPRRCTAHDPGQHTCYYSGGNLDGFYEGGSIVYSQYVPHDTAKLIKMQGGREAFIKRLDYIFDNDYFDSTNEPSQQIPYMYHYADRPALSTERTRETISLSYNTSVNGLPGNDDSGAMGSFVAFLMLGLYPLPGTKQFLISTPYFPTYSIYNPIYNKTLTVVAKEFVGNPRTTMVNGTKAVTGDYRYIKSIKFDGRQWKSNCFIEWDFFRNGGTLELELTDDRNVSCGGGEEALPPSVSTGGYGS